MEKHVHLHGQCIHTHTHTHPSTTPCIPTAPTHTHHYDELVVPISRSMEPEAFGHRCSVLDANTDTPLAVGAVGCGHHTQQQRHPSTGSFSGSLCERTPMAWGGAAHWNKASVAASLRSQVATPNTNTHTTLHTTRCQGLSSQNRTQAAAAPHNLRDSTLAHDTMSNSPPALGALAYTTPRLLPAGSRHGG